MKAKIVILLLCAFSFNSHAIDQASLNQVLSIEDQREQRKQLRALKESKPNFNSENLDSIYQHLKEETYNDNQILLSEMLVSSNDPTRIRSLISLIETNNEYADDNPYIKGLASSGHEIASNYLLQTLKGEKNPKDGWGTPSSHPRKTAAKYFAQSVTDGHQPTTQIFLDRIKVEDNGGAMAALVNALKTNPTPELMSFIVERVKDPNQEGIGLIFSILSEDKSPEGLQRVINLLSTDNQKIKKAAIDDLEERIRDDKSDKRKIKNALISAYHQVDSSIEKDNIVRAIIYDKDINDADKQLIVQHLKNGKSSYDDYIADVILEQGNMSDFIILEDYIEQHGESVYRDITSKLVDHTDKEYVVNLLANMFQSTNNENTKYKIVEGFLKTDDPKFLSQIIKSLEYKNNYKKEEIIAFIEKHGSKDDFTHLFSLLGDSSKNVRLAAFDALSRIMKEHLNEDQRRELFNCMPKIYREEKSEALLLAAALFDIAASRHYRTNVNRGIAEYNRLPYPTNIDQISDEQIETLKRVYQNIMN